MPAPLKNVWRFNTNTALPPQGNICGCCGAVLGRLILVDETDTVWGKDCYLRACGKAAVPRYMGGLDKKLKELMAAPQCGDILKLESGKVVTVTTAAHLVLLGLEASGLLVPCIGVTTQEGKEIQFTVKNLLAKAKWWARNGIVLSTMWYGRSAQIFLLGSGSEEACAHERKLRSFLCAEVNKVSSSPVPDHIENQDILSRLVDLHGLDKVMALWGAYAD